ncbi:urease accessory protein UreF [Oceanicola sp. 22II-s10i]|uniref:urease accessory protein UreF n=1 Tax=Oceanicola sp. 22II-s10i TaxID=1317116 RepID=UPI000B51FC91|nr:urease accessory protein UreF [Oceanicola sp. 22II-s10i]OWU85379.1 urease accessory protein UreF [Oceanicola sp. 22II-s10i]
MATDPALILHQWLSPAFPVGAFAYSHGMEWEVAAGRLPDVSAVARWLDTCLTQGAGRNDAILLAAAYRAEPVGLPDLADLAEALAPSRERREETMGQGRAFTATVNALHGLDLPAMAYPVALGRAAAALDLPLDLTLRLFLQAFAANLVSAATRLVPLGQTEAQKCLAGLGPLIETLAEQAAPGDPERIGGAVPMIDIASMRHETQGTRLFRS